MVLTSEKGEASRLCRKTFHLYLPSSGIDVQNKDLGVAGRGGRQKKLSRRIQSHHHGYLAMRQTKV